MPKRKYNTENKANYDRVYRVDNKEILSAQKAKWYQLNKERLKREKQQKVEHIRNVKNKYEKARKKSDPIYKIFCNLRSRISGALHGRFKPGSAVKDMGCTAEELKKHIESLFYNNLKNGESMNWDNHGVGDGKWQVDHIKALCLFDLSNKGQFIEACHYTNLQPLWHEDHVVKTNEDVVK